MKKQSMESRYHEHSGEERKKHGDHKSKHPKRSYEKFKEKKEKKKMAGGKVHKVLSEFKHGELHSGSKKGPMVKNRKQAVAIALSEARKAGQKVSPKKKSPKEAAEKFRYGH